MSWQESLFWETKIAQVESDLAVPSYVKSGISPERSTASVEFVPRSKLRERLILGQLARVDPYKPIAKTSVKAGDVGLSPASVRRSLSSALSSVRQQDAAEDAQEYWFKHLTPLQQTKERQGWYRTSASRNTAIEGILDRERRLNATLSRAAFSSAKARAASSRQLSRS